MKRTKTICELCGREISASNITKHLRSHDNGNFDKLNSHYHVEHDSLVCEFCGKECKNKNSLTQHEIRCNKNSNKISTYIKNFNSTGRKSWNKGLTKMTDSRVKQSCITLSNTYKNHPELTSNRHLSEETKLKISVSMKKYLTENPDKIPYIRNHSSHQSYPEKYFCELFKKENVDVIYHYQVGLYQLDFANTKLKIDIEIDGEQHYVDKTIVEHDIVRTNTLIENGWTIYRIRWATYKKSTEQEKLVEIEKIKNLIKSST